MRRMQPVIVAILMGLLAACSTVSDWMGSGKEKAVDPNLYPADYRKEILDTMRGALPDVYKIRDAGISEPQLVAVEQEQRYVVCVRANARDAYGRYPGAKDHIGYFYAGHLNMLLDAKPGQCERVVYKPFPELERLCAGKTCENPS